MLKWLDKFINGGPIDPSELKKTQAQVESDTLADTARKMVESRNLAIAYARRLEEAAARTRDDLREMEKTLTPPATPAA